MEDDQLNSRHEYEPDLSEGSAETTDRTVERKIEDREYLPVIVKRTDESVRHPDDILQAAIEEGREQHTKTSSSLFLSAVAAGMILGFAAMVVALASQVLGKDASMVETRLVMALFYPLGFVICIMSGTQLFTEQTATATYPVLDGKSGVVSLLRVWVIVLLGNLVGAGIGALLITSADTVVGAEQGYRFVAEHLLHFNSDEVLISAILAGWLMAQGGWLILATPPASSQVLCIYIVTFIIGLGGLHHSIAGAAEVFSYALVSNSDQWPSILVFIATAACGNLIGGSLFVGVLNYGHIRKAA